MMSNSGSLFRLLRERVALMLSGDRVIQFAIVGIVGTIVDFGILFALVEFGDYHLEVAKILGGEAAILVMFVVNEYWTFSDLGKSGYRAFCRRFITSNLVRTTGILVATGILSLLVRLFGLPYLLANVIGVGCGFFVNFFAESYFTWRVHR